MSPTLFRVKGYGARWAKTAVSICLIGIGVAIAMSYYHRAHIWDLEQYKYGDPKEWLPGFKALQLASLRMESLFVLGYFLVLSGFAWIHRCWAVSTFGRRMARYAFAAVIIMAAADLAKDYLSNRWWAPSRVLLGFRRSRPWFLRRRSSNGVQR